MHMIGWLFRTGCRILFLGTLGGWALLRAIGRAPRLLPRLRALRLLAAREAVCPWCAAVVPLFCASRCGACGYKALGHVFARCAACGTLPSRTDCPTCTLSLSNPGVRSAP